MQTHVAPVQEAAPEQPETKRRNWTPLLIAAAVVLGLVTLGLARWVLDDDASDPQLETVTQLVDTMHDGLNERDVDKFTSVFTEDGVWGTEGDAVPVANAFQLVPSSISDWERVSEVTELGDDHYIFVQQFHGDGIQRNAVEVQLNGDLISQADWIADFYSYRSADPTSGRTPTVKLTAPSGRVIPTFNATQEHLALVEWGLDRYRAAGLDEPPVQAFVFPPSAECDNVSGSTVNEPNGITVHLCFAAEEICANADCTTLDRAAQRTVLHELAHVWEIVALDESTRTAFLELRGLDHWFDDPAWGYRGTEQAAEVMAWGLLDTPTDPVKIPDQRSCTELLDAYRLLTGTEPPRTNLCTS
jgi:hypothetical protein